MSGVSFVDLMGIKALAKVRPRGAGRRVCAPAPAHFPPGPRLNSRREVPNPREQGGYTLRAMRCWSKLSEPQHIHQGHPEFFLLRRQSPEPTLGPLNEASLAPDPAAPSYTQQPRQEREKQQ